MRRVPREEFVPANIVSDAYLNIALPIGDGQTISQPLIVAQMTSSLQTRPGDRILEVGTGSGYQAAVLSLLVHEVITVERIPGLTEEARTRLSRLGYHNVRVEQAVEELGWPEDAPYDGMLVTAGAPELPLALLEQLRVHGRMAVPTGPLGMQDLLLVTKTDTGHETKNLGACAFVPLVGRGLGLPEVNFAQGRHRATITACDVWGVPPRFPPSAAAGNSSRSEAQSC